MRVDEYLDGEIAQRWQSPGELHNEYVAQLVDNHLDSMDAYGNANDFIGLVDYIQSVLENYIGDTFPTDLKDELLDETNMPRMDSAYLSDFENFVDLVGPNLTVAEVKIVEEWIDTCLIYDTSIPSERSHLLLYLSREEDALSGQQFTHQQDLEDMISVLHASHSYTAPGGWLKCYYWMQIVDAEAMVTKCLGFPDASTRLACAATYSLIAFEDCRNN